MVKRVSVKGRGADIFFGDYTPVASSPAEQKLEREDSGPLPPTAADRPGVVSGQGHDANEILIAESMRVSKNARMHAPKSVSKNVNLPEQPPEDSPGLPAQPSADNLPDLTPGPALTTRDSPSKKPESFQNGQLDTSVGQGTSLGTETSTGNDVLNKVLDGIWRTLMTPATLTNAFRYTDEELSALTDATYELAKSNRAKLSKQDVARLGLNAVLYDYRVRGDESLLSQFVRRKQEKSR